MRLSSFTWHSQITSTYQPSLRSAADAAASRAMLRSNFSDQNLHLVFGIVAREQLA
jgi:hypothetical protein